MKPDHESLHRTLSKNGYSRRDSSTVEPFASQMKVITLRRRNNTTPLGFSIRGGWEHGTGIFVSEVQSGSIAQRQGLRVGDQIVRINGFNIHRAIHMEVLSLLKTCPGVVLKVRRVGILPVKEKRKDPITWKFVDSQSMLSQVPSLTEYLSESSVIVKIEFSVPGSTSLGCSIAKGPPEKPGIFMCTVKEGGLADKAGLEVGDQIMDMNGTSFFQIKLPDAVALMKASKDIKLTVKKGAGICLFSEQSLQDSSSILNSQDNKINGSISSSHTLHSRQTADTLKDHAFSGDSSSKSEDSSFQSSTVSSDSEKDYSISEESGIHSIKPNQGTVNGRHKKSASLATTASGSSDEASRLEDNWLIKEKKKLEEEQRKLAIEKQRLEEEKRRLKQLAKSTGDLTLPLESEQQKGGGFLEELQKKAAKMNFKDEKTSIDQLILDRKNSNTLSNSSTLKRGGEKKDGGEDSDMKKRQHELLMQEFRQAHRKMFGQQESLPLEHNDITSQSSTLTKKPSTVSCTKSAPPLPLSKTYKHKITINGQHPSSHSQTLPRSERIFSTTLPKASNDDITTHNSDNGHKINFKITFDTKRGNSDSSSAFPPSLKGTLVQVKPWTTRL